MGDPGFRTVPLAWVALMGDEMRYDIWEPLSPRRVSFGLIHRDIPESEAEQIVWDNLWRKGTLLRVTECDAATAK